MRRSSNGNSRRRIEIPRFAVWRVIREIPKVTESERGPGIPNLRVVVLLPVNVGTEFQRMVVVHPAQGIAGVVSGLRKGARAGGSEELHVSIHQRIDVAGREAPRFLR